MRLSKPLVGLGLTLGLAVAPVQGADLEDLYFGEALYHAYQGNWVDALTRLDAELALYRGLDEPRLDTLHLHADDARFSVGDFELNYRMHHRAGRAIRAVLEGAVDPLIRNEAAYRLARIHFQKGQWDDAVHALARIEGPVPEHLRDDVEFLRANVALARGRPGEAVEVLEGSIPDPDLAGFVAYNLGIALLQDGRRTEAIAELERAGRLAAGDPASLAIRDKANLVLGSILFEATDHAGALDALDRVRLDGPFSNQALLRAGWAATADDRHDRALVPWSILVEREPTDIAVQEAMLAAPHAYGELELHGRAAILYGRALAIYEGQIERIEASIQSVRDGRFLAALVREEARRDREWVIRLRTLPDAPETYYLMELLASHDFQTALQNYLDLEDLQARLDGWKTGLHAFDDLLRLRRENYEPILPGIDDDFRELDARMRLRLEQKRHVGDRLRAMLTAPRPDQLATAEEQAVEARLHAIEARLGDADDPATAALRARVGLLRGTVVWRQTTEYHVRLTEAHENLAALEADVEALRHRHDAFVRARQAATHGYVGYDLAIGRLHRRVDEARERIELLMARQGHLIEVVAIQQLEARRERLIVQRNQAHFAVAQSYDRAARLHSAEPEAK